MPIPNRPRPRRVPLLVLVLATAATGCDGGPEPKPAPTAAPQEKKPMANSLYDLSVHRLDGKPEALAAYRGKVALVVNTASACGYTPQYAGLERLYAKYKDRGLVVLGFPSNDFGGQEPGTAEQIATFCRTQYDIEFPMFEKVKTKGDDRSEVYAFLGAAKGEPKWNFHKYLVDKDGKVVEAFPSKVDPESPELVTAIEKLL